MMSGRAPGHPKDAAADGADRGQAIIGNAVFPDAISVTDMHTGGEPVRIIDARDPASGWPEPLGASGASILEKRAFARAAQDHLRRFLMFEPRGHFDMYGALVVHSALPGADFGVLFMHNEGWSTMCGHAVIALARHAVEQGWVARRAPVTRVVIECPCGPVAAAVNIGDGTVTFDSVPAFLFLADGVIDLAGFGPIRFDIAYGGAFYALADAAQFGLAFGRDPVRRFVDAADALTAAVAAAHRLDHPDSVDLAFLYGSILTDGGDGGARPSTNVCVFAAREVDRSPTGSGVTARMAAMAALGAVSPGDIRRFESITGAVFTAELVGQATLAGREAVMVRVGGKAHHCGTARFTIEAGDPLGAGFLVT
jgi:proline racemase